MNNIYIHPTANVSEDAEIGKGTKVWMNSQIRENAEIGENCIISKDTYIDTKVQIGDGVKIQNGVSIFHGVIIEDDVFVGPNVVFTNDLVPRAFNQEWKIIPTLIKKGASIGANATIICGNVIGRYAMIGAGSVITKNIPDHALVIGNPAKLVGFVCECGHRLKKEKECRFCGKKYNMLGD